MGLAIAALAFTAALGAGMAIDFEAGLDGWRLEGIEAVDGPGRWGKVALGESGRRGKCLVIDASGALQSPMIAYSGQRICVEFWMKLQGVRRGEKNWMGAGAQILAYGADRKPVKIHWGHWDVALEDGTTPWIRYSRRLVLPEQVKFIRLQLLGWHCRAGRIFIDDARLELRPAAEAPEPIELRIGPALSGPVLRFWDGVDASHLERLRFPHYQRALDQCQALGISWVRVHTPLACIKYDAQGMPADYSFMDRMLYELVRRGLRVYFTIEPMPDALALRPRGDRWCNVSPPKDWAAWRELVRRVIGHLEERFGKQVVRSWAFGVWNEPFAAGYFNGTHEEYLRLYRETVEAAAEVDPLITIGGPDGAGGELTRRFLEKLVGIRATSAGCRADFVSIHAYAGSGYKEPTPLLWKLPLTIARTKAMARRGGFSGPIWVTEWNCATSARAWSTDAYGAAFIPRAIAAMRDGAAPGQPYILRAPMPQRAFYFALADHPYSRESISTRSLGLITLAGVFKPTANCLRFMAQFSGAWLEVAGRDEQTGALAAVDGGSVAVVVWNSTDDPAEEQPARDVVLKVAGAEGRRFELWMIDERRSNFWDDWRAMESPERPTAEQVERLRRAEGRELAGQGRVGPGGVLRLRMPLPSVACIVIRP